MAHSVGPYTIHQERGNTLRRSAGTEVRYFTHATPLASPSLNSMLTKCPKFYRLTAIEFIYHNYYGYVTGFSIEKLIEKNKQRWNLCLLLVIVSDCFMENY